MAKLIKCKTCGAEIAKSAKRCPQCGAKNKKSVLGIILLILLVFILLAAVFGEEDPNSAGNAGPGVEQTTKDDTNENSKESQETSNTTDDGNDNKSEVKKTSFTIGESVELNNVVVTLIDVYEVSGNGFMNPSDGNVFVVCEFEIENKTSGDITVSSLMSFEAYFDDYAANIDISAITLSEKTQLDATVAAGKKIRGVVGYQAPADWKTVELQFSPSFWSYKKMIFTFSK